MDQLDHRGFSFSGQLRLATRGNHGASLGALAIVACTVATGVYLREITRFVGRWLSHPRNIVQLVTVLIVGYLVFLAVVSPAFRVQLFSLAIAVAALWLMWKALIVPLAPKKKKSS